MRYRINAPKVISETVDGEALIINLESGAYYSASGSAEAIWALLSDSVPVEAALDHLAGRYAAARDQLDSALRRLLGEFIAEALLVPADETAAAAFPGRWTSPAIPFPEPVLAKYTDMEELLVLDPIHEVAATGWPAVPGDPAAPGGR